MKTPLTLITRVRSRYRVVEATRSPPLAALFGNDRWWEVLCDGCPGNGASFKAGAIRSMETSIVRDLREVRRAAATLRAVGYHVTPPSRVKTLS